MSDNNEEITTDGLTNFDGQPGQSRQQTKKTEKTQITNQATQSKDKIRKDK